MKARFIKRIVTLWIIIQLLAVFTSQIGGVRGESQRTIRIVDYATGLNYTSMGNETTPMPAGGWPFTVKILLDGATRDIAVWQVTVTFDNNTLRCTSISIPGGDPSYIFNGKPEVPATDFSEAYQNGKYTGIPQVVAGSALLYPGQAVNVSNNALLAIMNFTALKTGNFTLSFIGADDYSVTFLQDPNNVPLPLASGQPYATTGFSVSVVSEVSKPVADFTFSPENPKANQTVTFDASSSYDPSGAPIQAYSWDVGDNTTAANVTWAHKYVKNGLYLVNLTVVNADNLTGSTTKQLFVGSMPTAAFFYLVNGLPLVNILPNQDEVTFNASESTAPDGTIVSYLWNFGDNSTANDTIVTHRYSARGVFDVNLTVVDSDGLVNSTVMELQVGLPPIPLFTFSPTSILVGDEVTFQASETGFGHSYKWDFGEGAEPVTVNDSTIIHAFPSTDNWIVTLTVFDSDGLHASSNRTVSVISLTVEEKADYRLYFVAGLVVAIIIAAIVVRKVRKKKEEILEI